MPVVIIFSNFFFPSENSCSNRNTNLSNAFVGANYVKKWLSSVQN